MVWLKRNPKDRKVIPDPIDDREFQELKESGKDGILLGITLNPKKCIGEKVRRIPINIKCRWKRESVLEDENNKFLAFLLSKPKGGNHTVNPNLWRSCLPYRYLQDMDNVAVIKMVPSVWWV